MQRAFIIAGMLTLLFACTKMDEYRDKYMENGSIVYPGKMDSVAAFSGKNRAEIRGLFTSDPKITKYKVFWNSRQDSIEVPVTRTSGVDTAKVIIPDLPEGLMSFEIRTYDAHGNISIPVNTSANVYGDLYQSALINRGIANAEMQDDGSALIKWADAGSDAGTVSMRIKYTDNTGVAHDTLVLSVLTDMTTTLPAFKSGTGISYQTAYLPNATAIDTFYTAFEAFSVKADVTALYLKNTGPFDRATYDGGRWGTLAAPWVTSANVINHSGYGGYASETWLNAGGFLVMESGWSGTANIVNGKISQTTTLPAGNYIFQVACYTEALDPVYIVAAAGSALPDISGLSGALGYGSFPSSKYVSATVSFKFTLEQEEEVTLGFLATMTSGNQYWRVGSVKLIKN
ncbi:DUF4998 domain-containing protein [[Flexibacter] sp. ATCC 35208]|uniref:DUF4998 domain-containing protein n=1 Tax=[Flexibacter] sp. ATCC 35208 TaxID=1936242 RepID=UPI0009D574FF|nr:DUF4998 domain-containing protein [[Flexibacter] sp. ATCC 35208]OMP78015.1 hypothetical protein BW716_16415 [[Flexibacter] sp. ATCC 35208]